MIYDTQCNILFFHHHTPTFNYVSCAKALPTNRRKNHARYQIHHRCQEKKQDLGYQNIFGYIINSPRKVLEFI